MSRQETTDVRILTDDIPIQELMKLVQDSGCFDWLNSDEEDVYSIDDGDEVEWTSPPQ